MKTSEILARIGKENGIEELEVVIMRVHKCLEEAGPALLAEGTDAAAKPVGMVLSVIAPAMKPLVEKLADLNKDGKIG